MHTDIAPPTLSPSYNGYYVILSCVSAFEVHCVVCGTLWIMVSVTAVRRGRVALPSN